MNYIEKLTVQNLVSFLNFLDCDKEIGARVSITNGVNIEYEPNTPCIYLQSMVNKKKFGFLFSEHGLVQIFKDNAPDQALVSMASEYGCFEQTSSCINFTKSLIGFMTSIFNIDYLKNEFDHRSTILKKLEEAITLITQEKEENEMQMDVLSDLIDNYNQDPSSLEKYLSADQTLMYLQHVISALDEYLQELYNFKNYHTTIREYVSELALDFFETNLKTGKKVDKQSFKQSLASASIGEFTS